MRRTHLVFTALAVLLPSLPVLAEDAVEVFFSPREGANKTLISAIEKAESSVLVQAKVFTSPSIAKALVDAKARQVKVSVLLDKSCAADKKCIAPSLKKEGVEVLIDAKSKEANSRNIIIDGKTVITGSFDLTPEAELELTGTLLIIRDRKDLAAKFVEHFDKHKADGQEYQLAAKADDGRKNEEKKETAETSKEKTTGADKGTRSDTSAKKTGGGDKINPNTASEAELSKLPGIGSVKAKAIIGYRESHSSDGKPAFSTASDLAKVSGIGAKTVEKLEPYLGFDGGEDAAAKDDDKADVDEK